MLNVVIVMADGTCCGSSPHSIESKVTVVSDVLPIIAGGWRTSKVVRVSADLLQCLIHLHCPVKLSLRSFACTNL
jgi:hypothetical protein